MKKLFYLVVACALLAGCRQSDRPVPFHLEGKVLAVAFAATNSAIAVQTEHGTFMVLIVGEDNILDKTIMAIHGLDINLPGKKVIVHGIYRDRHYIARSIQESP